MAKSITRTVLQVPSTTVVVPSNSIPFDSGPLDVGDLVELSISGQSGGANMQLFVIDANGNPISVHDPVSGSINSYGAGTVNPLSFGDTIQLRLEIGTPGASITFSLSIEGK
jgi:hypothetical protein